MLRERLIIEQAERDLSDADFAELLGIPRVTWTKTRRGTKPIGLRIGRAALRAFPSLRQDAINFLAGEDTIVTKRATNGTTSHHTTDTASEPLEPVHAV